MNKPTVAVIGMGYVGLAVAAAMRKQTAVIGYDISAKRIQSLTGLPQTQGVQLTTEPGEIAAAGAYIVCVATPIENGKPNMKNLVDAIKLVNKHLKKGDLVVIETTMGPGATEALAAYFTLRPGEDFALCVSPERINPGDATHGFGKVAKLIAGWTPECLNAGIRLYQAVHPAKLLATEIRVAEMAKVVENTQRDVNIAFANEMAMICKKLGISRQAVWEAASTKWNFLPFEPGLVGGACVRDDPYFLYPYLDKESVTFAAREMNEAISDVLANELVAHFNPGYKRGAILGLTFKKNVPIMTQTKVYDLYSSLKDKLDEWYLTDPIAIECDVLRLFGKLPTAISQLEGLDVVVLAQNHEVFSNLTPQDWDRMLGPDALVIDLAGVNPVTSARVWQW